LPYNAWAYYASAADDSISKCLNLSVLDGTFTIVNYIAHVENGRAFSRFFFHPRVMRPVSECDTSTTILGYESSIPVYISGAALARLGHPLGEINLTRGAYKTGIAQMVSNNASLSYGQIAAARGSPDQPIFFQIYKHFNDAIAEKRIREVEALGYKAIFLTVDALVPGNRELDIKAPYYLEDFENQGLSTQTNADADEGEANQLGSAGGLVVNNDANMTWEKVGRSLGHGKPQNKFPSCCRRYPGYEASRNCLSLSKVRSSSTVICPLWSYPYSRNSMCSS
jgi:L-lactate dehydrogenase (cytochrome)